MEFIAISLILFGAVLGGLKSRKAGLPKSADINASLNISDNVNFLNQKITGSNTREENKKTLSELASLPVVWDTNFAGIFPVRTPGKSEPEIFANSAVVLDMESGNILFQKGAHNKLPIASISKIVTALIAYEKGDLEKVVTISKEAVDTESNAGDLEIGEKIKLRDLIGLMLISSSNDAAVQIALEISGSMAEFGKLMNKKARDLGLKESSFSEPSGLSDGNLSTAFEVAQVAKQTFGRTPIWDILNNKELDITSVDGKIHHLKNTNEIISESYIISGKTGYTAKAKGTLAIIADSGQNNRKVISVILGSDDRFGEMKKLIEWARGAYKW